MIRVLFLCSLLCLPGQVFGITSLPKQMKNLPAEGVLVAEFTQRRTMEGIPRPLISEGKLTFWQGHGLIWQTLSPFPSTLILTQQGIHELKNGQLVQNAVPQQKSFFNIMSNVLSGQFEMLKGFDITQSSQSAHEWEVTLTPHRKDLALIFHSITLRGDAYLTKITIKRPQGDVDEIDFSHIKVVEKGSINSTLTITEKAWLQDG